ncbi:MAG: DNA polymerase III subunit delta [Candidatus Acidiferrales bacterium]
MPDLSPDKLLERLAKGKPVPAIVLEGTDPYLRDMCRGKIIDAYVPEPMRDWALGRVTVRGGDWRELFQRAETMPMLAPCQVVLVDGAESIQSRAKGDDESDDGDDGDDPRKDTLKALADYLAKPAPFTVIVFEVPKLDHRQRLYKVLAENAVIVELTLGGESAAALAEQMAKDLGAEIERPAANLLAEIVNSEPARIRVEMQKVAAYAHGRGRITAADVEELVPKARKNTVWQLADMLATRRRGDAFAFLENLLREGEEPIGLVGVLAWMYRKLIEARDLPAGMNGFQAARSLQMRPDAAEAAVRNAHRIPKQDLLTGLLALAEADSQLKSSNPNPRALMEFLIARLTSSATSVATSSQLG